MNYETMEKIKITPRAQRLSDMLFYKMLQIEADRAVIVTESYKETENLSIIKRRSHAFRSVMEKLPITIREGELIVGSNTKIGRIKKNEYGISTYSFFLFYNL